MVVVLKVLQAVLFFKNCAKASFTGSALSETALLPALLSFYCRAVMYKLYITVLPNTYISHRSTGPA